ncbi:MAG: TonB C-terminal domain-containing protein [Rubellimicrobium sp.]|nr:TonB C-terminal domain-containing protein [Rubellimicrobium sp.]
MTGALRQAGLWSGAAALVVAGHLAVGVWLMRIEAAPGGGVPDAIPVEIVIEAAPDIPPEAVPELAPDIPPPPQADTAPDMAPAPDTPPPVPDADLPPPDMAETLPEVEPAPLPVPLPDLMQAVAEPVPSAPPLPDAPAPAPPPDAVPLPAPVDLPLPDLAEALPDIQPPPEPEPDPETAAPLVVMRPPARPDRPPPQPQAPRPAPAASAPARASAPAPAPAPAPAAPSAAEVRSWQAQAASRIARHMQRTRLPNLRGQVQASLNLTVAPSGAVSARLATSTGNPDADAALARQAGSIPALPPPPGGTTVSLVLPVVIATR